ncbi:serine/threonine-protein kinase [Streptomyces sp. NPDC002851]
MEELAPDEPTEIAGYHLRGRLGQGGMGVVYLSHTRGGQPVALKVVRREYAQDPVFKERFTQEVTAARRVQGPYTAPVLDSRTEGTELWLATAYVPGPPLSVAVSQYGALPLETVLKLAGGMAEALKTIHGADIVHRDLKPSNVLLAADGPRVIDFGIARAADSAALTGTSVALGTPAYMAPEQATGGELTPALDVFALGLIMFYAVTGGHPYGGDGDSSPQAVLYRIVANEPDLEDCPQELRGLIQSCLAKEPTARPSPEDIVERCAALAGQAGLSRGEGWWLPPGVAAAVAAQERQTMDGGSNAGPITPPQVTPPGFRPPAPSAPPAQPPAPSTPPAQPPAPSTPPAAGPPAPSAPPAQPPAGAPGPFAQLPTQPPQPAAQGDGTRRKSRTPLIVAAAVAGALVVGGVGSVFGYKLLAEDGSAEPGGQAAGKQTQGGDASNGGSDADADGGGKNGDVDPAETPGGSTGGNEGGEEPAGNTKTEPGWRLTQQDKAVTLQAPKPQTSTSVSKCDTIHIDPDEDFQIAHPGNIGAADYLGALAYHACQEPDEEEGLQATAGSIMSTTTQEFPTPSACLKSARNSSLPNPVPLDKLRNDSVFKANTGICLETEEKRVVHLWIRKINRDTKDSLPTYLTTATMWEPEK